MKRLALPILGFLCVASSAVAEEALTDLLSKSPFGTAAKPVAAAENTAPLEFRGVFVDKGEPFFSLFDPATKSAQWIGLNEPGNPFVVRAYDTAKNEIVVEYQGRKTNLGLKQAKVTVASSAAQAPGVVQPAPATPPASAPAVAENPEEAKRQAEIADEIRRRRALRQEAAGGVAPASAPVQPPPPGNSH